MCNDKRLSNRSGGRLQRAETPGLKGGPPLEKDERTWRLRRQKEEILGGSVVLYIKKGKMSKESSCLQGNRLALRSAETFGGLGQKNPRRVRGARSETNQRTFTPVISNLSKYTGPHKVYKKNIKRSLGLGIRGRTAK